MLHKESPDLARDIEARTPALTGSATR
jgi:hypothetical protein